MRIVLQKSDYRSASNILNNLPGINQEIENTLLDIDLDFTTLSRSHFNQLLKDIFVKQGWLANPSLFHEPVNPLAKIELIKENIGLEIGFRHTSLIGHNLIKFQLSSSHNSDKIDVGVLIVTTTKFQKHMRKAYHHNWTGAMTFEKVDRYLRHFNNTIKMPIYLVGIDMAEDNMVN
jgi:hypothetical protein